MDDKSISLTWRNITAGQHTKQTKWCCGLFLSLSVEYRVYTILYFVQSELKKDLFISDDNENNARKIMMLVKAFLYFNSGVRHVPR